MRDQLFQTPAVDTPSPLASRASIAADLKYWLWLDQTAIYTDFKEEMWATCDAVVLSHILEHLSSSCFIRCSSNWRRFVAFKHCCRICEMFKNMRKHDEIIS